jgi:hypothetical protein
MAGFAAGGQQNQAAAMVQQVLVEGLPRGMALEPGLIQIIHSGPAQFAIVKDEAAGLDYIHGKIQAGRQA